MLTSMSIEQPDHETEVDGEPDTPNEDFGCAAFAFLVVFGGLGLIVPFLASEFEAVRAESVALLWKAWIPGGIAGVTAAVWRMITWNDSGHRPSWGRRYVWFFGFLGYTLAALGSPRLMAVFCGFASGLMLSFFLVYGLFRLLTARSR